MDDLETALKERLAILKHRGRASKKATSVTFRNQKRPPAPILTTADVTVTIAGQDIAKKHIKAMKAITKASIRGSLKEAGILNKNGKMIDRVIQSK